jgi:hypothetical protein
VKLDEGPVARILEGSVGDDDGLDVEGGADDSLVGVRPALTNLVVKLVQVTDHPHRLLRLALAILTLLGDHRLLALDELAQPLDRLPRELDGASEVADGAHYGIRSVPVAHSAESDDVLAWLAGALACHARVGVLGRRTSDMGSGEKDDTIVVFAEAEIECAGALVVGRLERGDGEAERRRERLAELGDGVFEGG